MKRVFNMSLENGELNMKIINVLTHLAECLKHSDDSVYAEATSEQLLKIVNINLTSMQNYGKLNSREELQAMFLPTASLQDIATDNGWGDRYLELSKQFEVALSAVSQAT